MGNRNTSEGEESNCIAAQEGNTPAKRDSSIVQTPEGVEEYVIDRIVVNALDKDDLKQRYRVRCYGYPPEADTWEAIKNLPRSDMVRFQCKKKLPALANLLNALVGLLVEMLEMDALDHQTGTKETTPDRREGMDTEGITTKSE